MLGRSSSSSIVCIVASIVLSAQVSEAADCSASISAFSIAGRGVSGRESIYRVALQADPSVTGAEFAVHPLSAADLKADVAVTHAKSTPSTGYAWLTFPASVNPATISMTSITKLGSSGPCTPQAAPPVAVSPFVGPTTVYDDSHPHADLSDATIAHETVELDADFKDRAYPDYPMMAREEEITGNVVVEIEVGPTGGSPLRQWVRWADPAGDPQGLLAQASLDAAKSSTFSPPVADGRPQSQDYLIVYTFSLGNGGGWRQPDSSIYNFDGCPLELTNSLEIAPSTADPSAHYIMHFTARSPANASVVLAIENDAGRVALYPWSGLTFMPPTGESKLLTATATLSWLDPHVKAMWVEQVSTSGGTTTSCGPNIDEPELVAESPSLRFERGQTAASVGIEPAPPPQYTQEVWPKYPIEPDGKRAAGHVTIDGLNDATGLVVDAWITRSSGLDDLDNAAMDAAIASKYQPPAKGALAAFETTYRFVP